MRLISGPYAALLDSTDIPTLPMNKRELNNSPEVTQLVSDTGHYQTQTYCASKPAATTGAPSGSRYSLLRP